MRAILALLLVVHGIRDDKAKARELLDAAGGVMKDAPAISVECESTYKGMVGTQKIKLQLKRPDTARIEYSGMGQDATVILDGKSMWYYIKSTNQFMKAAQTPGMIDSYGAGPIATIFYDKGAGKLLESASDLSVKKDKIKDEEVDQISWKLETIEYRLWIDGKKTVRQYQMEVKQEEGEFSQTVTFGAVDLSPKLADDTFAFTPPKDAKEMQPGGDYDKTLLAVDSEAPDFEATDLEGKTVKLSDFKGKVVLLNFWFHG